MSEQVLVTMEHAYACGYCAIGARRVLREHGLDHRKFFKEGLPVEKFDAVDDYMFQQVAQEARSHGR